MTIRERLALGAHLLVSIEIERRRRKAPGLLSAVEREIIARELAELASECRSSGPEAAAGTEDLPGSRHEP